MLEHPRRVAHPLDRGEVGRDRTDHRRRRDPPRLRGDGGTGLGQHRFGEPRPDHRAAARVGTLRQTQAIAVARQQPIDLARERRRITEVDQHAVPIGEDLGRVDVRRGHDRLAHADRVGQRAARDLRGVRIGRRVDVRRLQIVDQLVMLDEGVDEGDVVGDALLGRERLQLVAILLALACDEVRVGRAEHDVEQVGVALRHRGQCRDHRLDPLVGGEQPEGQHNLPAAPAEPLLQRRGIDQIAIGHAVRDHRDLARIGAVDARQDLAPALRHDDDARRAAEQTLHHPPLVGARLLQDGVERHHQRQRRAVEQRQDVLAGGTAVDAVFVLQPQRLRAARLDPTRSVEVRGQFSLRDRGSDGGGIVVAAGMVVHRVDVDLDVGKAVAHRGVDVGGEGREPALPGQEIADHREMADRVRACHFHHRYFLKRRRARIGSEQPPERTVQLSKGCALMPRRNMNLSSETGRLY